MWTLENQLLDRLSSVFEIEMPVRDSLDEYVDAILPKITKYSENIEEQGFLETRWLEVRDADTYHETVLHVFLKGGEYLVIIDGNITKGAWQSILGGFAIQYGKNNEFFEPVFLNEDFFILRKHGREEKSKYLVFGEESEISDLQWRDIMELLFNIYRSSARFSLLLFVVVAIIAIIIAFSFL